MNFDDAWFRAINSFAKSTPWLHGFMAPYALWGGVVLLVILLVIGWLWSRFRAGAPSRVALTLLTGVSAVVALLINQHLLSPAIARTRPCHALSNVETLLTCKNDFSMPSDHCIIAGAIVAGLWILNRWLGIIGTILALLLAFGRVYVGVHYPSDTAVGLLAGAIICVVIVLLLRRPTAWLAERIAAGPLYIVIQQRRLVRQRSTAATR